MVDSKVIRKKVTELNLDIKNRVKKFEIETGCYVDFINVDHLDASEFDEEDPYILKEVSSHIVLDFNNTEIEEVSTEEGD
jgi:hypothetical protein